MKIEITDSISKTIQYPPPDKELCDWCWQWIGLEKINITERNEFVCDECLSKENEESTTPETTI